MRVRNFNQIMLSKETDSFIRQWHGYIGTAIGGTVSLSVTASSGQDQKFVTDISFQSNLAGVSIELLNGTAFMYQMMLPAIGIFSQTTETPMKTSQGTNLNINLSGLFGTVSLNIGGYDVK